MSRPVAALLAFVLAGPARADDAAAVRAALDAINAAFEKGDAAAVGALMTDDHVAVTPYYGGPQAKAEQLRGLGDHKLTEYKTAGLAVRPVGTDAALVTYDLTMRGTYKGKPVPAKSYASAVWVRRGGKWLEAFYQETPLDGK